MFSDDCAYYDPNDAAEIDIVDNLSPEDLAMLQALYSRSTESHKTHLDKIKKSGSSKFMDSYYVGYNHKSIGDCGSTTIFMEYVSILAAKAIQDWPLYSGQETSTRYMDMTTRPLIDPVATATSRSILNTWMNFYHSNQDRVAQTVREQYPIKNGENPTIYEKAVKARVFDIMRGFLPAGITTQLSWHTNLRQAADHLTLLQQHPSSEIKFIAYKISELLACKYPSSGFLKNTASVSGIGKEAELAKANRELWENHVAKNYSYHLVPDEITLPFCHKDEMSFWETGALVHTDFVGYEDITKTRPKGCILPHFLSYLGQCHWYFSLDFGSFRDLQRHRNGVCLMPLLTTDIGFESWYLNQFDLMLREQACQLIDEQTKRITSITDDPVVRQYYTALGFKVITHVTYPLPAAVYVMELRSSKTVHPTLRNQVHRMITMFKEYFPTLTLHVDMDPNDWDVRRGTQTITEK